MIRIATVVFALVMGSPVWAGDIAVCGASAGYGYYPEAGLLADAKDKDAGTWHPDGISAGRITLSQRGDKFDLLYADISGAVVSASGDGGQVVRVGQTATTITVIVNYPGASVETYTFIQSATGAEVIWSSNKYGTLIPRIGAYRASCSLLILD